MFNIAIKEAKEFLRDKMNLFFFLMFPVILVFLLGNLLGSMDKAEETVGMINIKYLVETENPYQLAAIQSFMRTAGDNKNLSFEETDDIEAAKQLAGKDEITAAVLFRGDPMEIQIYEGSKHIQNRTVGAILNSFAKTNKAVSTVIKTAPEVLTQANDQSKEYIKQKDLGVNRTMIDYYAVSMVVMISFMSALIGSGAFVGERDNKTINRLIAAPQSRVIIFLQKILGLVPQVVAQISAIMLISTFVFNANYAADLGSNLYLFLMFFIVTLCMISIGAVIGLLIKTNPMVLIMPVLWIMMFFGGTYSKEINIKGLTDAMPMYQIQQAAFDLSVFGRFGKANMVIIICSLVMVIALAFGAFIFSRKEEER